MVGDTARLQSDHSRLTVCAKEQQRPSCGSSSEGILDQVGLEDGKSQGEWRSAGGTAHTPTILWPRREGGGFGKLLSPWACRKLLFPSQGRRFGPCLSPCTTLHSHSCSGMSPRDSSSALGPVTCLWQLSLGGKVLATPKCLS